MSEKPRTAEYPFHAWPQDQVQPDPEDVRAAAGSLEAHADGGLSHLAEPPRAHRILDTYAAYRQGKAEGVAAERERIRVELLAEADLADERAERAYAAGSDRPGGPVNQAASSALRDFARRLERP